MDKTDSDQTGRFLVLMSLFSLACHLILIRWKDVVGTDELIYLMLGENLWHGRGFTLLDHPITMSPPLLPVVAGFFSLFTEKLDIGTNFTYVFFGALVVIPFFCLARRIYGTRVAKYATYLIAFYPGLLLSFYWGSLTEPLYVFVLVTALLFSFKALEESRIRDFALAGVFLSLVYLTRSEGFLFFLVLFAFSVVFHRRKGTLPAKGILFRLAAMTLLFCLVSSPYVLFLKKHSQGLSISGKTKLILLVGNMDAQEKERLKGRLTESQDGYFDVQDLVEGKTLWGLIRENPKTLVGGSFVQVGNFFVTLLSWKVFPAFLCLFVVIGFFRDPWDHGRVGREAFLVTACLPFFVFLTFKIWPRYLIPMTPILILWTAKGVVSLQDWIKESVEAHRQEGRPAPRWIVLLPTIGLTLAFSAILVAKPLKARLLVQYPIEYKIAGEWINRDLPKDATLLARKPQVAYYANRTMHLLPNEGLPTIIRYANKHGIKHLVLDDYSISTRPQLKFLLEEEAPPAPLLLLHELELPIGRKLRIFEIREQPYYP